MISPPVICQHKPVSTLPGLIFPGSTLPNTISSRALKPGNTPGTVHGNTRDQFVRLQALQFSANPSIQKLPGHSLRNIMLPSGVPVFFLHGTFATSVDWKPLVQFISGVETTHPTYSSYIPEVKDALGIETVADPSRVMPSYKLAIRDMGDFRTQVTYRNLKPLRTLWLDTKMDPLERDNAIARVFQLLPEAQAQVLPVLKQAMLAPIFASSLDDEARQPLWQFLDKTVGKLMVEVGKLGLSPDSENPIYDGPIYDIPIYDSYRLHTKALVQGKTINMDMKNPVSKNDVVNIRAITLQDVTELEARLGRLEAHLAKRLSQLPMAARIPIETERNAWATRFAQALIAVISPQGLVFGHSQGGTVLLSALLNSQQAVSQTKSGKAPINLPDMGPEDLGGQFMGIATLFSAPVNGIPDMPAWGIAVKDILKRNVFKSERLTRFFLMPVLWHYFQEGRPAVPEMRVGSPLMRKIKSGLEQLTQKKMQTRPLTIVAAHDPKDTFIEPSVATLPLTEGAKPGNLLNIALDVPDMPLNHVDGEALLESEIRRSARHPRSLMSRLIRSVPLRWQNILYRAYRDCLKGLTQHSSLLNFPVEVHQQLGERLVSDPRFHAGLLQPENFEPFRYQLLLVRRKILHKLTQSQDAAGALSALLAFQAQHPQFLSAVIANAQQSLPMQQSAGLAAEQLLGDILGVIEKADRAGVFQASPFEASSSTRSAVLTQLQMIKDGLTSQVLSTTGNDVAKQTGLLLSQLSQS
ncbi:MAG: hypothetical protein K2X01_04525 [Cyanobacteria bacterium]|nr:hypothetical protein [Cyanobacteriota bacterium]